jgi:predicted TIM-barrel fold metal-dependent hydrolase
MNKLDIKDIPIIDTHIHLTNINDISYKWKNDCPELFKNWTEEQYLKETKNLNIKTGIFVEVAAATFEIRIMKIL